MPRTANETMKSVRRSTKTIFGALRRSPSAIFGIAIIVAFLVMAIFAPILSPYTPGQTAPDPIQFTSDSGYIHTNLTYVNEPASLMSQKGGRGGSQSTTGILVYNREGQSMKYSLGVTGNGSRLQLKVTNSSYRSIPSGLISLYNIVYDPLTKIAYIGLGEKNVYILSSNFSIIRNYSLSFNIQYFSGIFNRYPSSPYSPTLGFAVSGRNHTFLFVEEGNYSVLFSTVSYYSFPLYFNTTYNVTSAPLPYLYLSHNPSLTIPTTQKIYNYEISEVNETSYVSLRPGSIKWSQNLTFPNGTAFSLLQGGLMFPDNSSTLEYNEGENVIIGSTTDSYILEYDRINGSIVGTVKMNFKQNSSFYGIYSGIYASNNITMPVSFYSNGQTYVTFWSPSSLKFVDQSYYLTITGRINGEIQYVEGANLFMVPSQTDVYYFPLTESAGSVLYLPMPSGDNYSPLYIGNLIQGGIGTAIAGNYVVTVNSSGQVFYESVVGFKISPLPPGSYKDPATGKVYNYPLGTDYEGHSIWSWIVYGARLELAVGVIAAVGFVLIGVMVGIISGYYGKATDAVIMRLVDVFLSLPFLIFVILLVSLMGPSIWYIMVAIIIFSWAGTARVVRAVTLSLKTRPYIDAARASGASNARIMTSHILPNVLPLTFFYMSVGVGGVIILEATLDFLGFGDPTSVTWGMLLQFLQTTGYTLLSPWWLFPPGIAIILLSLSFYLVGRGFDEIINPRLRRR